MTKTRKRAAKPPKRRHKSERRLRRGGVLRGTSDIRRFFRANETPIWCVSAAPFDLLGVDRWVRRFRYVNYHDSFDGHHPRVFVPRHGEPRGFTSAEDACNYLLAHGEVVDRVRGRGAGTAVLVASDETTERLAEEAGLEVAGPPAALRARLSSPTVVRQLATEAGVPLVPDVRGRASSYGVLHALAVSAGLGRDLVVQVEGGTTAVSVGSEGDWSAHAHELAGRELLLTKRLSCREVAVEGVVMRHGTLVGPVLTEAVRVPRATARSTASFGSEVTAAALPDEQRAQMRVYVQQLGERLGREGYRGLFSLSFLVDRDAGAIYLGELAPRITRACSPTNVAAVARGEMPPFLFHLLELSGARYELDVDRLNAAWAAQQRAPSDAWHRLELADATDEPVPVARAPRSGIWRLDPARRSGIRFVRRETDWRSVAGEDEAFYLRIVRPGDRRCPGAATGVLVTRGRLVTEDRQPTERARAWLTGIERQLDPAPREPRAAQRSAERPFTPR